jgi:hypothetical protein
LGFEKTNKMFLRVEDARFADINGAAFPLQQWSANLIEVLSYLSFQAE